MGYAYIYDKDADDLSTTGLCGALWPIECTHEEIEGGLSEVTLVHPFDPRGKWEHLKRGNILKVDTRVRTTPEIENGQVVTTVERWTVKETATLAQRTVYTKAVKGKKKKALDPGTRVWVTQKGESRYKFTAETVLNINTGKKAKEPVGWIAHEALAYETTEILSPGADGIEAIAPPWIVRSQLFRIREVELDTDAGTVTVIAPHISYDLENNVTNFESNEPLAAPEALNGIKDGCDYGHEFEFYTDIGDKRTSFDAINISPIQALLDPDEGFLPRWDAELVRDDFELYFLHRAGRNRGARIEYGKNLLGVNYRTSDENIVTAIKPTGVNKDGSLLYLTDDPDSPGNYIMSPRVGDYPVIRAIVHACEDCTVEKGKKGVTLEIARARMREQAERMFAVDKIDLPDVSLTVDFISLGDTVEYQQYKDLAPIYLYDEVPIIDKRHGIEVQTNVHRIVWDCLHERVIEMELGNVREGVASIYNWQLPHHGINGDKLTPGTGTGDFFGDGEIPINKMDPDLQEALNKAWADIEAGQKDIETAKADIVRARSDITQAYEDIERTKADAVKAEEEIAQAHRLLNALDTVIDAISIAVGDNQADIAALRVDRDAIRAAVRDAENGIAALEVAANEISTTLEDTRGEISRVRQQADEIASTVRDAQGDISELRQTSSEMTNRVEGIAGDVSLQKQTSKEIANAVQGIEGSISLMQQRDDEIAATITDAQGEISRVQQRADEIASTVSNAEGNIATLRQQADGVSSTISGIEGEISTLRQSSTSMSTTINSMQGEISSVRQTANGLSNSVSTLNGQITSLWTQLANVVSVKLRDANVNQFFEALIANDNVAGAVGLTNYGIYLDHNGTRYGGMWTANLNMLGTRGLAVGSALGPLHLHGGPYGVSGPNAVRFSGHLIPSDPTTRNIGTSAERVGTIYGISSVNTSDERKKRDIAPLNAADLLDRIYPIRYYWKEEADGTKLNFGVGAQGLQQALKGTDYENAALLHDEDPENLYVDYAQLIPVLIEDRQRQQRQIAALEARLTALEQNKGVIQ